MYVYGHGRACAMTTRGGHFSYHVSYKDQTQVIRLGGLHLCQLSHLADRRDFLIRYFLGSGLQLGGGVLA